MAITGRMNIIQVKEVKPERSDATTVKESNPKRSEVSQGERERSAVYDFGMFVLTSTRVITFVVWWVLVSVAKVLVYISPRVWAATRWCERWVLYGWALLGMKEDVAEEVAEDVKEDAVKPEPERSEPQSSGSSQKERQPEVTECARCGQKSVVVLTSPTDTRMALCNDHNSTMGIRMRKTGWK